MLRYYQERKRNISTSAWRKLYLIFWYKYKVKYLVVRTGRAAAGRRARGGRGPGRAAVAGARSAVRARPGPTLHVGSSTKQLPTPII